MYRFSLEAHIIFEMDEPPKSSLHLSELLELVEQGFHDMYKVKKIKTELGSVQPFIKFNHHWKRDEELCPYSLPSEKHGKLARVIYGYIDDNERNLKLRHGADLYLAGCVPDSYSIDIEGVWFYPTRYCNFCNEFSRFMKENSALSESP